MARLPQVGGDKGNWGDILNEYLEQSHAEDGTLKADSVGAAQLVSGSVTSNAIADGAVTLEKMSGIGAVNGIASLDAQGVLPEAQLPTRLSEEELATTIADTGAAMFGPQVSGLQDTIQRIRMNAQDVNVMFLTDSTGTYDQATWTSALPASISALHPTHTVVVHKWNYTTGLTWDAGVTIATGTGPYSLHFWMAGAPGENWPYFHSPVRRHVIFGAAAFDLVNISLGHNDDALAKATMGRLFDRAKIHIEKFRLLAPYAQFVLVSQNPVTVANKFSDVRADGYRRIAAERGYGFIDCTTVFFEYQGAISDLVPNGNLHPTAAGYALWRQRYLLEWVAASTSRPLPQALPSLTVAGRSVLPRLAFPIASNGWTLSNLTETSEATIVDRRTASTRLTKTAAGSTGTAWIGLPNEVRGRRVFIVVHCYIPASSYANTAQVQTRLGGAVKSGAVVPVGVRDQWFDIVLSDEFAHNATAWPNGARVYINVDAQGGAELPTMYIEDVNVFIGNYPLDPIWVS